ARRAHARTDRRRIGERPRLLRESFRAELRVLARSGSEPGVERQPGDEPRESVERVSRGRLPRPRRERRPLLGPPGGLHVRAVQRDLRDVRGRERRRDDDAPLSARDDGAAARVRRYLRVGVPRDHARRPAHADARRALAQSIRWRPVIAKAIPATAPPSAVAVTSFQNMHVAPQPGVASDTRLSGNTMRKPTSGPRRYHGGGQRVIPTMNPMRSRAVYQPQTAIAPRM